MPTSIETYPDFEPQVREFVQQHRKSKKGRLHLAVYFAPPRRARNDIFLFEIIDGFGGNEVDSEGKFFEFAYGSTPAFPLDSGVSLRMVLTNPTEFHQAVNQNWKGIEQLRASRNAGRAIVIHADPTGKKLWESIK